jgi:uncharacterized FAD-dependent dehydrogenase
MLLLQINGLFLEAGEPEDSLHGRVASLLGVSSEDIHSVEVLRRSLDARRTRPPRFVYLLRATLREGTSWGVDEGICPGASALPVAPVQDDSRRLLSGETPVFKNRPVIVGAGPAGLFAALSIVERGAPALLLERGKTVPIRVSDVEKFWERGVLNPESNVCFGEGGAGTFSDGKLTSRVKNPLTATVKRILVDCGAPADILVDAHPHIGTDRLRSVVVNMRRRLVELGCEVRFESRVTDLLTRQGKVCGVIVNGSEEIVTDHVILALGQSCDDTFRLLDKIGVAMTVKAFAIGVRVEHPQELIDKIQYGRWAGRPELPPAEYFLTARLEAMNRSVYSFCMCPGGAVIATSVEAGGVTTNGMSMLKRDGALANSAVVVNVRAEDIRGDGPLAGLDYRRYWERMAFVAGGLDYCAPAQRLTDFMFGRKGTSVLRSSYRPGVREAEMASVLPPFAAEALKTGFAEFERKMAGFVTEEAVLTGIETRTSSPVRILRGDDGQSNNIKGLFPCGEGAGYAGGIISSALDGMKAAFHVLNQA